MKSRLPASPLVRAALVALSLATAAPVPAHAAWPNEPFAGKVDVCIATGDQLYLASIPDGVGGSIVGWMDNRTGTGDIYVQRISAAGIPQWTANGVALCTATGLQWGLRLVTDGAGGAIATWHDSRSGSYDIYARRVNSAGVPQWTANGVAVCTASGLQFAPTLVPDNTGGAIITWDDQRSGTYDIYAQRLSSSGTVQWATNGVAVCVATGDQQGVSVSPDGAGGAILAWTDERSGINDIYAQRMSLGGTAQWTANGIPLCSAANNQIGVELVSDGGTSAIAVWQDYRSGTSYDIYAQRVTSAGAVQWGANGTVVSAATDSQESPVILADGFGGVIVAWNDYRVGTTYDVYAQRMGPGGAALWTTDGLAISTATYYQYAPRLAPDGTGGAIIVWEDGRYMSDSDLYAQRVSAAGVVQWTTNGVAISSALADQTDAAIVADGTGGAIIAFVDDRSGAGRNISAQRVERFGRLGNPEPVITSVKDVRNDQGGVVKVSWAASYLDADPVYGVNDYRIWRSLPTQALATRQAALRRGVTADADEAAGSGKLLVLPFAAQEYAWELVGTQAAAILPNYSYAAATLGDSMPGSYPRTAFMIEARQSTSLTADRWFSAPDSGYSVDNLAPAAPAPLTGFYAAGSTRLAWNPNHEADLAGYHVYRGASVAFVPSPANLVSAQPDTGAVDAAGAPYVYKVTAVDVHGNESPVATLVPAGTLDAGGTAPTRAFLALASANPSRGPSTLRFGLATAGRASLALYDAGGRRVRTLLDAALEAGEHSAFWDGRDEQGHEAPTGLYFARLETGGDVRHVRIVRAR